MRISGLGSGMDIDKLVSDLMRAERLPLDKMRQQKQRYEWQRDDYRSMNTLLRDLDTLIFNGVGKEATFLAKNVVSSNESIVSGVATSVAANTTSTFEITQLARGRTYQSDAPVTFVPPIADTTLSFQVKKPGEAFGSTITVDIKAGDSATTVAQKLSNSTLGVSAHYDSTSNRFILSSNTTGGTVTDQFELKIMDTATESMMLSLGFSSATAGSNLTSATEVKGQNATVNYNGVPLQSTTNSMMIAGVQYTLKGTNSGSPVTVQTNTNTNAMVDSIKKFVEKYNEAISKINGEVREKRFRDFAPLTDEQKESMTDKQIELWEEKARSGMLYGDTILSSSLTTMRNALYQPVTEATVNTNYNQLQEIGITTSPNFLDNGKLLIDETKLRQALEKDPNGVYKLFNANGTTNSEKGIAVRLRKVIDTTIKDVEKKAGNVFRGNSQFDIGRRLLDLDNRILNFNQRLADVEARYYRQFSAMDSYINQMNQQSAYISNLFNQ